MWAASSHRCLFQTSIVYRRFINFAIYTACAVRKALPDTQPQSCWYVCPLRYTEWRIVSIDVYSILVEAGWTFWTRPCSTHEYRRQFSFIRDKVSHKHKEIPRIYSEEEGDFYLCMRPPFLMHLYSKTACASLPHISSPLTRLLLMKNGAKLD